MTAQENTGIKYYVINAIDYVTDLIDGLLEDDKRQTAYTHSYRGKQFTVSSSDALIRDEQGVVLKYAPGETRPADKEEGDDKIIPIDTQVEVTDIQIELAANKDSQNKLALVFANGYGWTSPANLKGSFINETLNQQLPQWDSEDPSHKVVGQKNVLLRKKGAKTYPERKPIKRIPKESVDLIQQSADGKYGLVARPDGAQWGWTAMSNLSAATDAAQPNRRTVIKSDARIREEVENFPSIPGKKVAQGERVVLKELSKDGKFALVAGAVKSGETWLEGAETGWITADALVHGWADYKGPTSAWERGNYIGQRTLIQVVGAAAIEVTDEKVLPFYLKMVEQANRDEIPLTINEGFRDYARQEYFRDQYDKGLGNLAAKPGHSNHQHGIALDIETVLNPQSRAAVKAMSVEQRRDYYYGTPIYEWLKKNAPNYGFVRTVTNESWHWEYLPQQANKKIFKLPAVRHKDAEDIEPPD